MNAIFVAAGAMIRRRTELPTIDIIDVAPPSRDCWAFRWSTLQAACSTRSSTTRIRCDRAIGSGDRDECDQADEMTLAPRAPACVRQRDCHNPAGDRAAEMTIARPWESNPGMTPAMMTLP